jgi:Holliday junction resolvase-like predicted endonuclease
LHYPVQWDWESPHDGDIVYGKQVLGKFTEENTSDTQMSARTLAKMMACRFNTMALGDLTNGAWFEKRQGAYIPYLPAKLDAEIKRIKGKWKKREAAEEIYRPFWIGTTRIDIPGRESETNAGVPRRVAKRLEAARQRMDIAGISFSGDVNGRKMWSGLIFEIQPLIVDYDARKAFHAVTVGLAFEHKLVGNSIISITPDNWPRRDQEAFWNEILHGVDKYKERLIPANELISSIILMHNDEILQVQPLHSPSDIKVAKKLLAGFQTERQRAEVRAKQGKRLLHLLQTCDAAETPDEKGRSLENLVAELFRTVPGLKVVDRRRRTQTEEIDLVISHDGNAQGFEHEEEYILVECKTGQKNVGGMNSFSSKKRSTIEEGEALSVS